MRWGHLLAAADHSAAGLHAMAVAESLVEGSGARLSVVTVLSSPEQVLPEALARYRPMVAHGVPGVEIVRAAEELGADLIVLGRTIRGSHTAPRLGPTADAIVRRSRVPCLFVPLGQCGFGRVVVALDGTERGLSVLPAAYRFLDLHGARAGGKLEAVTVEKATVTAGVAGVPHTPAAGRIAQALEVPVEGRPAPPPFRVLQGEPAARIRSELRVPEHELLVIGARRGGPGGLIPGSTGVGRLLLYTAPCAVLTIPL